MYIQPCALIFFKSFFMWANSFDKQLRRYAQKLYFMLRESKIIFLSFLGRPQEDLQV